MNTNSFFRQNNYVPKSKYKPIWVRNKTKWWLNLIHRLVFKSRADRPKNSRSLQLKKQLYVNLDLYA